jgi:hypothetical protein
VSTIPTYVFFYKFISYVASYVDPIQTGFLRGNKNVPAEQESWFLWKNATGTENTGIRRIPVRIGNLDSASTPVEGFLDPQTHAIPDFMLTFTTSTPHSTNRIHLNKHLNNVHLHPIMAAL